MKISIIGSGYAGLVSAACFANLGHQVNCIDVNQKTIDQINNSKSPLHEPGLEELLQQNKDNISAHLPSKEIIKNSDIIFISVGTPNHNDEIDLSQVNEAAQMIGNSLKDSSTFHAIVVKSTTLPGTTVNLVHKTIDELTKNPKCFGVSMNPEFLREGSAVNDFLHPDRIIIGSKCAKSIALLQELYSPFQVKKIVTTPTSAEMIKYTANCYLSLNVAFANEISNLCETLEEVDSTEVFEAVFEDRRITMDYKGHKIRPDIINYLKPNSGLGGSCLPKDLLALNKLYKEKNISSPLMQSISESHKKRPEHLFSMGKQFIKEDKSTKITFLGSSFKANTDDIRESPTVKVIELFLKSGYKNIHTYDQTSNFKVESYFNGEVNTENTAEKALENTQLIYLMTAWEQFTNIPDSCFESLCHPNFHLIDTTFLYQEREPKNWRTFLGVGPKP